MTFYDVRPLQGNHDDIMLEALQDNDNASRFLRWYDTWGQHTLASFDEAAVNCNIEAEYV